MAKINMTKQYILWISFPLAGFLMGWKLDKMEDERLSKFRDKSALYRRAVPPEVPSW